ncbi:hypothetical protein AVEN_27871-1 [Araneus ventricosus]|uniref:Uncharacterized protein n=1 Tax=Araneus ventricosus TaxID=182803 RepID=A0A4Y2NN57_ARAVE|nr:hypothetical protein AVEN_27871-1 [Araneus ventricosus]
MGKSRGDNTPIRSKERSSACSIFFTRLQSKAQITPYESMGKVEGDNTPFGQERRSKVHARFSSMTQSKTQITYEHYGEKSRGILPYLAKGRRSVHARFSSSDYKAKRKSRLMSNYVEKSRGERSH